MSYFLVEGGFRAVMFDRLSGVSDEILNPGIHFRVPWLQYPTMYDLRAKSTRITSPTGTKDLQMVNISIRVLSKPSEHDLAKLHRNLGTDYDERVFPSIVNEVYFNLI